MKLLINKTGLTLFRLNQHELKISKDQLVPAAFQLEGLLAVHQDRLKDKMWLLELEIKMRLVRITEV